MQFTTKAPLLGVKGSKGSMEGEGGKTIYWDFIEVHVLAPLDEAKGAFGNTAQIHKLKFDGASESAQFHNLKNAIGTDVELVMAMTSDGKGGASKMVCQSVDPIRAPAKAG